MTTYILRSAGSMRSRSISPNTREHRSLKPRVAVLSVFVALAVGSLIGLSPAQANPPELRSTIAFSSTRDHPDLLPGTPELFNAGEIYLIDPATNPADQHPRRLTDNVWGEAFANLSPDGKRIVFDRNPIRTDGPVTAPDLFLMKTDGTEQTHLTRGSSATWSPDSRTIAFDASASGSGQPINRLPGAATTDSDIFVVNVGDLLDGMVQPTNITNTPLAIDDDPDWSPDGHMIVFTSHSVDDHPLNLDYTTAEIYVMRVDSHGIPVQGSEPNPQRLTFNHEEERAPAWSPDGTRIAYMCHGQDHGSDFEICVMNADGNNQMALTTNTMGDLTPTWSPDGTQIAFHRPLGGGNTELFLMTLHPGSTPTVEQLTHAGSQNLLAHWGQARTVGAELRTAPAAPQPRLLQPRARWP